MKTKRGYLASVLLAGVMIAGYLGMLPLLQSLAAEPAWPDAPGVSASSPTVITVPAAVAPKQVVVLSKPAQVKKTTKKSARPAHRAKPKTGTPARTSGSSNSSGGSSSNENTSPSGGSTNLGGSGSGSGGSLAGGDGIGGSCAGC